MGNKDYGRKWTALMNQFIKAECPIGLKTKEFYPKKLLLDVLNNIFGTSFNLTAFAAHCHDNHIQLGIKPWQQNTGVFRGKQPKPLWSEHLKKGIVQIKTPEGWMSKARWIYQQIHPEYVYSRSDNFIYLDGNNRNFDKENIALLNKRELIRYQSKGGTEKGHPEISRLHILQARLELAMMDEAERKGLVSFVPCKNTGTTFRLLTEDRNRKARENRKKYLDSLTPEELKAYRKKCNERNKEYRKHWTPEQCERKRQRAREWARKKRLSQESEQQ